MALTIYNAKPYVTLSAAINAMGSNEGTLIVSGQEDIADDLTIPANICVEVPQGGSLTSSNSSKVTFVGHLEAGLYQVFEGDLVVEFGSGAVKEVYPEWWGAKGDNDTANATTNRVAIQAALDAGQGKTAKLSDGTYYVDDSGGTCLWIKYSGNYLFGMGRALTIIKYHAADASSEATVLKIDRDTYNSGSNYTNIKYGNFEINGDDKALWGIWMDGFTSHCRLENVEVVGCVGWLYSEHCWYSTIDYFFGRNHIDGLPTGMPSTPWVAIHNSATCAPFTLKEANSVKADNLHFTHFGTSDIPSGKAKTYQILYLTGNNLDISKLSLETSNDYGNATDASIMLIRCDEGSNHSFDSVYIENVYSEYFIRSEATMHSGCSMRNIFGWSVHFSEAYVFTFNRSDSWTVEDVNFRSSGFNAAAKLCYPTTTNPNFSLRGLSIEEGSVVDKGGNNYSDAAAAGQLGILGTTSSTIYPRLLTVLSGLTVTNGNDGTSHYVLVEPESIYNGLGMPVNVGRYVATPNVAQVGRLLRPTTAAANWNVCVDHYGCVFLEDQASLRMLEGRGKLILATFDTDGAGAISNLVAGSTGYFGIQEDLANKQIFLNASDTWDPGNILNGANEPKDITVTGAALGDFATASFSLDVQDLGLEAQVTANDTVTVLLSNTTGGAIDLAEGTVYVKVIKR